MKHGTVTTYKAARCKCAECREANAAAMRSWRKRKALGIRSPYAKVLADAARRVLIEALAADTTYQRISDQTGIHRDTLTRIVQGQRMITSATEHAVLSVQLSPGSAARVDAEPYRTHLRRLGANGWSHNRVARMCGHTRATQMNVFRDRALYIYTRTARELEAVFAEIGERAGPDEHEARYYRSKGYLPPAAYDEEWRPIVQAA